MAQGAGLVLAGQAIEQKVAVRVLLCDAAGDIAVEIAMTAHLVMPTRQADDAFLQHATRQLHERFEIEHVTVLAVRVPFTRLGATAIDGHA